MQSRVPPANHLDAFDVALAAAAWTQGIWNRPLRVELRWSNDLHGDVMNLMAGGDDASDTVTELEYTEEVVEMLRELDCLSYLPKEFWAFLQGKRFNGNIEVLPEGRRFPEGQPYGTISGGVGEVLLFQSTFEYVLAFQVGMATQFANQAKAISRAYPKTRFTMVEDASRWSVGHGWSLWQTNAGATGGARPIKLEVGVLLQAPGGELFLQ